MLEKNTANTLSAQIWSVQDMMAASFDDGDNS
jgi:hypothetical protein